MINLKLEEQVLLHLHSVEGRLVRDALEAILLQYEGRLARDLINDDVPIEIYRQQGAARMVAELLRILHNPEPRLQSTTHPGMGFTPQS